MKRFVLERHVFGDAPIRGRLLGHFDVPRTKNSDPKTSSSSPSPRVYLAVDRYAAADVFHKFDAMERENDFESVHCDGDISEITMHEILSPSLVKTIVERIVDDCFAYWRVLFRYGKKLIDVAASTTVGKSAKFRNIDHDTIRVVVQHLGANVAATCDETGVRLNNRVDWFVRWNELNKDVRGNVLDAIKKVYHGHPPPSENATLGPINTIHLNYRERTPPTTSLLYFDNTSQERRPRRSPPPVVSLRDTMLSLMGDYSGGIVANDRGVMTFIEPLCTYRFDNDESKTNPSFVDRPWVSANSKYLRLEHTSRINLLFNEWRGDGHYRKLIDEVSKMLGWSNRSSTMTSDNSDDLKTLLGEVIVDIHVAMDLAGSLLRD